MTYIVMAMLLLLWCSMSMMACVIVCTAINIAEERKPKVF